MFASHASRWTQSGGATSSERLQLGERLDDAALLGVLEARGRARASASAYAASGAGCVRAPGRRSATGRTGLARELDVVPEDVAVEERDRHRHPEALLLEQRSRSPSRRDAHRLARSFVARPREAPSSALQIRISRRATAVTSRRRR